MNGPRATLGPLLPRALCTLTQAHARMHTHAPGSPPPAPAGWRSWSGTAARRTRWTPSPSLPESRELGAPILGTRGGLTAWAHPRPAPVGTPLLSRDHSRGAPDPANPGPSAVETARFALAPASGGGPALARTVGPDGPSARGPESSRSSTVGERIRKRTAARSPPRRRCPAPVSGLHSGDQ